MPHLHDAHWMISSVVPRKLPVIRGLYFRCHAWLNAELSGRRTGWRTIVAVRAAFSRRGSHIDRWMWSAHHLPVGSFAPRASVWK